MAAHPLDEGVATEDLGEGVAGAIGFAEAEGVSDLSAEGDELRGFYRCGVHPRVAGAVDLSSAVFGLGSSR